MNFEPSNCEDARNPVSVPFESLPESVPEYPEVAKSNFDHRHNESWLKNHEFWAVEWWCCKKFWKCTLEVPTGTGSAVSGSGGGQIHCRSSAQCLLTSGWKTTNLEPPNGGVARNSERPLRNRFRSIRKCPDSMLIRERTFVNSRVFSRKFKDVLTNAGQHLGAKFVSSVVQVVS